MRVAIIGAGLAGLTVARQLQSAGVAIQVFDKGRGVGGRTSTRRSDSWVFDHGAQYFTVRDPAFRAFLNSELPADCFAPWAARFARLEGNRITTEHPSTPRLVGVPGMNSICQALALQLPVQTGVQITRLNATATGWTLEDTLEHSYGPFEWVVCSTPPAQGAHLLSGHGPLASRLANVDMRPCLSLMIAPSENVELPADGIQCDHPVLGWAARNHSKPGRPPATALVIQSNHAWAQAHQEDPASSVCQAIREAAEQAFDIDLATPSHESLHRWLYAAPAQPLKDLALLDQTTRLAACGDWCAAGKLEGAFQSGLACAEQILGR